MLGFYDKVLLDNAYESWTQAIKYANLIYDGVATFGNKKLFVSSLHNAVELFLKQIMIDENDYRVGRPKNSSSSGDLARHYYNCGDINSFFLDEENSKTFISEDFKIIVGFS
ncbi:MAG: hypothetical protein R3Y07_05955 [Eubacteriales bacterium]